MIPLTTAISGRLTWAKHNDSYELSHTGEAVASLRRASLWSTTFLAECGDARWIFRRTGLLGTDTEILDPASNQLIAKFKANWLGGGTLSFSDGQMFRLSSKGFRHPVWSLTAFDGRPILRIHVREGAVELVEGSSVAEGRLPLLIVSAWHRVVQVADDAASVAVMSATS
jgi:hypothetical protein